MEKQKEVGRLGHGLYVTRQIERTSTGLWVMRGSKRRNAGKCQYRPLSQ